jgi:hypothetical protein
MTLPSKSPETERLVEEIRARQRNTVWPDTRVNGSAVDAFLWKGSPNPTLVQRIGAWILGLFFALIGILLIGAIEERAPDAGNWLGVVAGLAFIALGGKVFRNGLRHRTVTPPKKS